MHQFRRFPLVVTYHPAVLLHNPHWKKPRCMRSHFGLAESDAGDSASSPLSEQVEALHRQLPDRERRALAAIIGLLDQAARYRVRGCSKAPGLRFFEREVRRRLRQLQRLQSLLELQFCELLDGAGLASEFAVGEPISVRYISDTGQETAGTTTPDFVHRRLKLAIYCDGATFHSSAAARERDSGVDRALQAERWRVLRFPRDEVVLKPEKCLAEVRRALRELSGRDAA